MISTEMQAQMLAAVSRSTVDISRAATTRRAQRQGSATIATYFARSKPANINPWWCGVISAPLAVASPYR